MSEGLTSIAYSRSSSEVLEALGIAFLHTEAVHQGEELMPRSLWMDDFSSIFEVVEFEN
ncbi:MAG: hypothetical protein VB977_11480 [Pseudohongiellaceae bacterium]